ncbi:MAG: hypothetical protein AAF608_05220 [Pseudomonadota bacterium]
MTAFLGILFIALIISVVAVFPVWLWFCIDDFLADLFGNPMVGEVPWYVVWVVFIILCLFTVRVKKAS